MKLQTLILHFYLENRTTPHIIPSERLGKDHATANPLPLSTSSFEFSSTFLHAMEFRLWMTVLLALTTVVVESSAMHDGHPKHDSLLSYGISACNDQVGNCIDDAEETIMSSESSRRMLTQSRRLISYKAVEKYHIPCRQRGRSYYDCD